MYAAFLALAVESFKHVQCFKKSFPCTFISCMSGLLMWNLNYPSEHQVYNTPYLVLLPINAHSPTELLAQCHWWRKPWTIRCQSIRKCQCPVCEWSPTRSRWQTCYLRPSPSETRWRGLYSTYTELLHISTETHIKSHSRSKYDLVSCGLISTQN